MHNFIQPSEDPTDSQDINQEGQRSKIEDELAELLGLLPELREGAR